MATTYTSTVEVNVWKEHTCVRCGAVFRYLFRRKKTGQGNSPEAARRAAEKAVVNALGNEVDLQPCPGCGLYQPDMIAAQRSRRHWYLFAAAIPPLAALLVLVLADVLTTGTAAWAAAGVAAALAVGHLLVDSSNPNRDLDANHRLARERVEAGDLWVPRERAEGDFAGEEVGTGRTGGHSVASLLLALGVLAFASPELLRTARGWPVNPGWHPAVAGPGDGPYLWFPDKVTSVKGHWNAEVVRAEVLNAAEVGLPPGATVPAESKRDSWGPKIRVKSSEKNSRSTLWARVRVPDGPDLAGKTLNLRITLGVRYPLAEGNQFHDQPLPGAPPQAFTQTATLRLAAPHAGRDYRALWWGGFLTGTALVLLPAVMLAVLSASFRKKALPTDIFVPQGPGEEGEAPPSAGPAEEGPAGRPAGEGPDEGRFRPEDRG